MYIQLVSYTRKYEEFDKCGVRFAGVSVDLPTNNKTMVEKLLLRFPLLSDLRGELAKRCGLQNAKEGVAVLASVVVDRGGFMLYLYEEKDFADRPEDDALVVALEGVKVTPTTLPEQSVRSRFRLRGCSAERPHRQVAHDPRAARPLLPRRFLRRGSFEKQVRRVGLRGQKGFHRR
jgi:hypothetical protein